MKTCANGEHKRIEVTCLDCIDSLRAEVERLKSDGAGDARQIHGLQEKLDAALLQLRAMVEERDLYSEVVDAAESWLKHHGHGGVSEAEANKALRYQVEQLGEKVAEKPKCECSYSPWRHCPAHPSGPEKRVGGSCVCRMDADEPSRHCPIHQGA